MKYLDFKTVFDLYSKRKPRDEGQEHDLGKVREKFTEIVDAVGIDSRLLKQYRSEDNGEMVKFGAGKPQFCFPETICDFCVNLILRYTSADFKKIRSAEYASVNPAASVFLIDGFTKYLQNLGHDIHTIVLQRWKMDRRLHHHTNVLKSELNKACEKLADSAKKYEQLLSYEDSAYFIRHMVARVKYTADTIEQIFSEYESARYDEFSNTAMFSESIDQTAASKDMYQTAALADVLEQDEKYQKLLKKLDKILTEPGFKRSVKGRYNKIVSELTSIRNQHEIELFGESGSEITVQQPNLKHPMQILHEAILSVAENEQDRIEREEKEANLSDEEIEKKAQALKILRDFYEKRGVCFELPSIDIEEDYLFLDKEMNQAVKGTIIFPCCKSEKVVVYRGSSGCCTVKCPNCGRISIFNFDKMASETVSAARKKCDIDKRI